jgi:16S rRNA (guanine527-N7)-methyltransferase
MSAEPHDDDLAPLLHGAAALGFALDEAQLARFARFRALLLDWNTRINLTAITGSAEVLTRHFLDALTCVLALPEAKRQASIALLDIGSGAGLPGLALAIALPHWRVTSLEATGKKVRFQQAVIADLALANAQAIAGRAEDLGRKPEHRGAYDIVTARALAALPTLLEYCAPFACVGGAIIAPKKGDLTAEMAAGARAASLLGAHLLAPIPVTLPPLDDGRVLLVARQERPCPPQYPRAAGAPLKRPLGTLE